MANTKHIVGVSCKHKTTGEVYDVDGDSLILSHNDRGELVVNNEFNDYEFSYEEWDINLYHTPTSN